MADIITTLHPEGMPEDDLYPNIKKENLPDSLQPVTDFAISEYEKTTNLLQEKISGSQYIIDLGYADLEAGTYYLSLNRNISGSHLEVADVIVGYSDYSFTQNGSFTISEHLSGNVVLRGTYDPMPTLQWAMLNKGSTALPYQPYNGKIIHAIDVDGIKLWENGSPSSVFREQHIITANLSGYSRLRLEIKYVYDSEARFFIEVGNNWNTTIRLSCVQYDYADGAYNLYTRSRDMIINSATDIYFDSATAQGSVSSGWLTPVAIYGIK